MPDISIPGVYDLSHVDYHADPCPAPSLSRSIIKVIDERSARHAWTAHPRLNPDHEQDFNRKANMGSIAHALMLGQPGLLQEVKFDNYRKNDAKDARDDAIAKGKIPALTREIETADQMAQAAMMQLKNHEAGDALRLLSGKPEQTLIWQAGGLWCRARVDWLPNDLTGRVYIDDYKTTGNSQPDYWFKHVMMETGCAFQDLFYCGGVRTLFPEVTWCQMRFIVQETEPPYALSVNTIGPETRALGLRRMERATRLWAWCLENDRWPGYSKELCEHEAPPWRLRDWEEQGWREEAARQIGQDLKERALEWQAPL